MKRRKRPLFRDREKRASNLPVFLASGLQHYVRYRHVLSELTCYTMFIGYPRSGHSLLGSLLNAHPEAVIAHELNTLRYLRYGFPRSALLGLLIARDQEFGRLGRSWSGYDYTVPNQHQGTYTQLRVIGDKRGRASTKLLGNHPHLLERLRSRMGLPLRVIRHTRNSYDNIATMARKNGSSLEAAAKRYFRFAAWTDRIRDGLDEAEALTSYHEDVIADPKAELARVLAFLGLSADPQYLEDCANCVFPSARKSRETVAWPPSLVSWIDERLRDFDHLSRYSGTGVPLAAGGQGD